MSRYVLPGDAISASTAGSSSIKLGPGLLHLQSASSAEQPIIAIRPGKLLSSSKGNKWWIDANSSRYIPAGQESVVGVVTNRNADGFRVDIGSAHVASLDALAFEGASKRNRPNLKVGSVVYARVSLAHKDMEPELECFDATTRKSDGFGELKGGYMVKCSLGMCRSLLSPSHYLLAFLGLRLPLETAVGINGRIWIKCDEPRQTIAVARCIEAVDERGLDQLEIEKFFATLDL